MVTHLLVSMLLVIATVVSGSVFVYFTFFDKGKTDLMIKKEMTNAYRPDLKITRLYNTQPKGKIQYLTVVLSFTMTAILVCGAFTYIEKHFTGGDLKTIEGQIADKNITQHTYELPRISPLVNNEYFITLKDGTKLVADFASYEELEVGEVYLIKYYKNSTEIESFKNR